MDKEAINLGGLLANSNTLKFLKGINRSRKSGGVKNSLDFISKFRSPDRNLPLGDLPKFINLPKEQLGKPTISRGIRTSLGNTAEVIKGLTADMGGKSPIQAVSQAGKNIANVTKKQVKGDLYKEVIDPVITRKGGKEFVKSKAPWLSDREVLSKTNRGTAIIRKRKALTPLSIATGTSGVSIGAFSYALGDKEQGKLKRVGSAAVDAGLFTVSPPVGIASALLRKPPKKKEQVKKLI